MCVFECVDLSGQWDCVATVFFIDTAHNIVAYVETIWKILKPNGYWINMGLCPTVSFRRTLCCRDNHTHSVLTAIFPGEPGIAGCPLNSPSPFIPGLRILLGQA